MSKPCLENTETFKCLIKKVTKIIDKKVGEGFTLDYIPEDEAKKSQNIEEDKNSEDKYPSVKSVYDFVNTLIKTENTATAEELSALTEEAKLIPGNYYLLKDFQTIYTIENSNSSAIPVNLTVTSVVSGYAILNARYHYVLPAGKEVKVTELPVGYVGPIQVGDITTVSENYSNYYFRFANGLHSVVGFKISYTLPKYANGIANDIIVNDVNGKPVLRPGGVLNTEVHDGTPYMAMTAAENLGVPLEDIVLLAKTTTEFELQGKSVTYPDDIIEYQLPIPGDVAVKGKILRRSNEALSIDVAEDWRVQRFRRWKVDAASRLKLLNQDQPLTSLTGNGTNYRYTSLNSSVGTPERFYVGIKPDSTCQALDANALLYEYVMSPEALDDAKDYPIFPLTATHYPKDVSVFRVTGTFYNSVLIGLLSSVNPTNYVKLDACSNTTFVGRASFNSPTSLCYDTLWMDSLEITTSVYNTLIINCRFLAFTVIGSSSSLKLDKVVMGIDTANYSSNPYPATRWNQIKKSVNSELYNTVVGSALSEISFVDTIVERSALYVYYKKGLDGSPLRNNQSQCTYINCRILNTVIMHRAKYEVLNYMNIKIDVNYNSTSPYGGRDVYDRTTDLILGDVYLNDINKKLYYEAMDASDVKTVVTYAIPKT